MGYCVYSEEGSIRIKKENMGKVLKALSDYFENGNRLRWIDGFTMDEIEADDEEYIINIWNDLRYNCYEEEGFYIINEFLGEKYGDDNKLFEIIAPYCENGYLQFHGEDECIFRFTIKKGKFKEVYPR